MNNNQKVLVGFLTGLVTGVVAGVLIAPEKGEDTRKKIADSAKNISTSVGDTLKKENLNSMVNTATSSVTGFFKRGSKEEVVSSDNGNVEEV